MKNNNFYFNPERDPVRDSDNDYLYDDRLEDGLPGKAAAWVIVIFTSVVSWFVSFLKIKA